MIQKIKEFTNRITGTFRHAPSEILLVLYAFVLCSLVREKVITENPFYVWLLPIFFVASFILNRIFPTGPKRIIYYLSPLLSLPFWWVDVTVWHTSIAYFVTLVICVLAVIISDRLWENRLFVERIMRYVNDVMIALLLSLVAFLLLLAIFYSVFYIFTAFRELPSSFIEYSALVMFVVLFPICFLIFNRDNEEGDESSVHPFLSTLLNYVMTPAVLIYTVILYLYFIIIVVQWTLPKGNIAYLVFGYAIVALLVKSGQLLLHKRSYDWYYNRFSLIALPALIMFWTGVVYRINQYGFTQSRVYLVVCGAIMTLAVLMFLNRKMGRYHYVAIVSMVLLALFTYVPGITADSIGIDSQIRRANRLIDRIHLTDASGKLLLQKRSAADTSYIEDYRALVASFRYLQQACGEHFMKERYGISGATEFAKKIVPAVMERSVLLPINHSDKEEAQSAMLVWEETPVSIGEYALLYNVQGHNDGDHLYYQRSSDTLYIRNSNDSLLFRKNMNDMLREQLTGTSYTSLDTVSSQQLEAWKERLLQYEGDSVKLIFSRLYFDRLPQLKLREVEVYAFLKR